ncbi:hypothetical protein ACFL2V_16325 [Pseudomonadota bacterium]
MIEDIVLYDTPQNFGRDLVKINYFNTDEEFAHSQVLSFINRIPVFWGFKLVPIPLIVEQPKKETWQILRGTVRLLDYLITNITPGNFKVRMPREQEEEAYLTFGSMYGWIDVSDDGIKVTEAGLEVLNKYREHHGHEPYW